MVLRAGYFCAGRRLRHRSLLWLRRRLCGSSKDCASTAAPTTSMSSATSVAHIGCARLRFFPSLRQNFKISPSIDFTIASAWGIQNLALLDRVLLCQLSTPQSSFHSSPDCEILIFDFQQLEEDPTPNTSSSQDSKQNGRNCWHQ